MRLTERKHILIDIRRVQYTGATVASPPAHLSLTEFGYVQTLLEADKEDLYDTARNSGESPESEAPRPVGVGLVEGPRL